jgi:CheY-like chemotaxis protein
MIRVLFVDDEDHIRSVLGRLFRTASWHSAYAASGEEALERFASEGPFDVVVTDQRMPGMSGLDLLRRLRAEHPHTVRMVLSSYTDAETVLGAINEGYVYKFLTKPWKNDVLFQTVAEVVEALELRRENLALQARLHAQEADIAAVDWLVGELESRPFEAPEPGLAASVLESAPVGVVALREDGTVAFANPGGVPAPRRRRPGFAPGPAFGAGEGAGAAHPSGTGPQRLDGDGLGVLGGVSRRVQRCSPPLARDWM